MVGKTRLLMKMAEEMCVVYICLRPEDSTGEPKRSLLATDMLPPSSPNFKAYYIKIIAAIFLVTAKFFQLTPISNLKKRYKEWNEHQTTPTFHRDVLQELRTSEQITDENDIAKYLTDAVTTVQQVFPEDPGLKVLLAIDEASAMLEIPQPKNNDVSFFRHFRRALRTIPDQARVFAILVDTTSRVSNFLPISREDNSSRALGTRGKPSQLFPPIYKIRTFDLMAPPRRAISYDTAIPSILHFALTKLLRSEDVTDTIKLTEARALALLGPTIGVPLHGQARLNVELTASHAAHVADLCASCQQPSAEI
ncbi:uncharacterized protein VP01_1435g5 [Puccinia sorghi]|uniref:Uncharacterized protein n=1 Tax=Puccinia sorghi TaxID=27349 RepID=A0A0L6VKI4_9BASI|nr:uncharacterized protein VP01_1435g5 [Puccinia sorghi]